MNVPTFSKLVLFGDSHTDGGERANGVYELTEKSWPAPPQFQGRFCNGPVWPEYLAPKLNVVYTSQDNFAVGGAKTDTTNFLKDPEFENSGILAQVRKYVHAHPQVDAQALFVVWGGGANFFEHNAVADETVEQTIEDLETCVGILVNAGAQTILLGNQISAGFSAEMRAKNQEAYFHQITARFNERLAQRVAQWQQQFSAKIMLANIAGLAEAVLADAQRFGFNNTTDTCMVDEGVCADPDKYLYWQGVHFTTAFHLLVAERFYAAITMAYA